MKISTSHVAALVAALVAAGAPLGAQSSTQGARPATPNPISRFDPTGSGDTSLFAPLNLPNGNIYRSGDGSPGPKYWEQRADYDLHGTLDTAAKALRGEMTLRYTNNSPDTLRFVWFQVEQNAFKNGSLNSYVFPAESRFGARNFEGGDFIDRFNQVAGAAKGAKGTGVPLKTRVEGTVMKVDLATPLPPGQTTTFDVAWHFNVPEHGADRMGRDGALYELASGAGGEVRNARTHHHRGRAEERRRAPEARHWHGHMAVRGTQRTRRRMGRVARLHVGRVELAGSHGLRLLSPERDRAVEGRGRHVAHVDQRILGALVPISVSADQRGGRADQRHGIPDARHGGPEP
jgi:hypothetical protein